MPIPVLDIWKSGGWVLPDGKTSIRVPNEEQALREGALHFVLGKDGVMDIYMWNTESNDMVTKFLERFAPPEDQYLRFHSAEPHGELMKRMFGRSKFLNKKADPEVKQYGQPTPANPLDNKQEEEKDLQIKKPILPGQPGNPPANQAQNGPLVEQQASIDKEAERTIDTAVPNKPSSGAYNYDPRMSQRTMPIAQPPTKQQGAPSWVTGSGRPKLLDKAAGIVPGGTWGMIQTSDGNFRYVNHGEKLLSTGFGSEEGLKRNADIIRTSGSALDLMRERYAKEFQHLAKKASISKVADDYGTVEDLQNFLSNFNTDAKIAFVSAASTYPVIQLPIYETWNNGGVPTISLDTDQFLAHIEKLNADTKKNYPSFGKQPTAGLRRRRDYGEKVAIKTPQVDAIPGMTPMGFPENGDTEAGRPGGPGREISKERSARRKANAELAALGQRYHDSMPIQEMKDILIKYGFNGEAMDGIYTGHDGKMHEQCGPHTWVSMTWHKMPRTGTWEIVAYLS